MTIEQIISGHEIILLDSCVLIHHIEQHPRYSHIVRPVLRAISDGTCRRIVSELTLMEIKTGPLRQENRKAAGQYELLLDRFPNLSLIPIDRAVLDCAARLRTPDSKRRMSSSLLPGLERGATLALTNDRGWKGVDGIEVVCLRDLVGGHDGD